MNGRKGELKEEGQKRRGGVGGYMGEERFPSIHNALTAKNASHVSSSVRTEAQRFRDGSSASVQPHTLTRRSIPGKDLRPLGADWLQLLLPWQ